MISNPMWYPLNIEEDIMATEVIVALVSLAGSALGVVAGVIGSNKLTDFRLSSIETKVNELDKKIDTFTDVSVQLAVLDQRIKELEGKHE